MAEADRDIVVNQPSEDSASHLAINAPPTSHSNQNGKLDFSKYRSDELFASMMKLLDLRGIYLSSFFKTLVISILVAAASGLAFYLKPAPFLIWAPIAFYGIIAGGISGLFFSIAEVIRKSLDNLFKVLDLMLEVAKTVAKDVRAMGTGETEIPSPTELVRGVYGQVILPLFERVVSDQLGFVGIPVLFLYRLTFGRMVRMLINIMPATALTMLGESDAETLHQDTLADMKRKANDEQETIEILTRAQKEILNAGGWFRFLVMIPCYVALGIVFMCVLIPFVFAWFVA